MQGTVSLRSVHGKYLSAQPDGRAEWNRDHASTWEYFQVEQRHNGKIALKGAHGMYLSAQLDGSVQINRREAPPGGWEEFTVEDRGNNVVCLKSCHGKYLSAQQNGTAQWNRDHAPRGGWEEFQIESSGGTGQRESTTITAMPSYVIVAQAGSPVVNGNYELMPGKHENRHWGTIAGHYQHTQNPEIFIAFQDCGTNHQRPEWNKWMIISKAGVLYAAHTGGKIGVPPREGVWENVEGWGNPGAPGGKHPAPTVYHPPDATTQTAPIDFQIGLSNQARTQGQYMFVPEEMAWNEHNDRAKAMGRHLATISSAEENEEVTRISGGKPVWIGGIRKGSGNGRGADHWYWSDGQPWTYTNWYHGEPNNSGGVENRVHLGLQARGTWNDVDERWRGPAVYEMPAISPTKASSNEQGNFEFIPISEYDEVWNDSGSGAEQDVSVWSPRVPAGCHLIGMTAKNGHSRPTFSTLVIRAGGRDIAPPERFDLVWWQERGKRRFWCWRPIPPAGYVSLGDVGTTSETPPSHKDVVCVALACLSPNRQPLGGQIWNDRGGGAPKDAAFFEQPGGTGLFRCSDDATHNKPRGEFPIPAGASTTPHTTQATSGIEILEAVVGKPVRFRISNRPSSNDAWVGIYPSNARDQDHGEQNKRWKWLREIDVNNASFPEQSEGDWSVRIFSDGGYRLHERKEFAVKPKHVATERARARPNKRLVITAFVTGMVLFGIGLPLFIGGQGPAGEENLGMIIPGAIMFGIGGFLLVGASFALISSWAESYATPGKPAPRWTMIATVFAAVLLIPGIALLAIGIALSGVIHHEEATSASLWISDPDGMGDQGFIIFIEGVPGDFDNNGIYDHCENIIVNATHSGSWMSDPWTGYGKVNPPDESRQVFEFNECESIYPVEQRDHHGRNLIKIGQACYGCMAGYTDISALRSDNLEPLPMWIQDGEKIVESTGLIIAGSIMMAISSLSLVSLGIIRRAFKASPTPAHKDSKPPSIEVLEAIEGKPVRFRINDPPGSSSAWVGIYPLYVGDEDHGEEGERWNWLSNIDVSDAMFPEKHEGKWSIRVFSDGGHNLHSRVDFEISPEKPWYQEEKKSWWEDGYNG